MVPDLVSGFFMPEIQQVSVATRFTNILIPINFHLVFKNLGLTHLSIGLKLQWIDTLLQGRNPT